MARVLYAKFGKQTAQDDEPSADIYAGGRHLKAVSYYVKEDGKHLSGITQAVLRYIGSTINFRDFSRGWYSSIEQISFGTGFGLTAVKKAIREALDEGVLERQSRRFMGRKAPSLYRLTEKLFAAFKDFLQGGVTRLKVAPKQEPDMDIPPDMPGPFDDLYDDLQQSPGDHRQQSRGDHKTAVASRPKTPPTPKIKTPQLVPTSSVTRFQKEAKQVGELIFIPADRSLPFVAKGAIHQAMLRILTRFGIDTVRSLMLEHERRGDLGYAKFDANLLILKCERIHNDAQKRPVEGLSDMLKKYEWAK